MGTPPPRRGIIIPHLQSDTTYKRRKSTALVCRRAHLASGLVTLRSSVLMGLVIDGMLSSSAAAEKPTRGGLVASSCPLPMCAVPDGLSLSRTNLAQQLHPPLLAGIIPDGLSLSPTPIKVQDMIEAAVRGGVDLVQIRDSLSRHPSELLPFAVALCERKQHNEWCRNVIMVLNVGRDLAASLRVAKDAGLDGIHLPERYVSSDSVQRALQALSRDDHHVVIGCSAHSVEAVLKAVKAGADYVQVGTMFSTQSHIGKTPEGPSLIKAARQCILQEYAHTNVLLLGVGGITEHNCVEVLRNGGDGVAVIRALSGIENAEEAAQKLKSAMSQYVNKKLHT